jgi:hypothetical protein
MTVSVKAPKGVQLAISAINALIKGNKVADPSDLFIRRSDLKKIDFKLSDELKAKFTEYVKSHPMDEAYKRLVDKGDLSKIEQKRAKTTLASIKWRESLLKGEININKEVSKTLSMFLSRKMTLVRKEIAGGNPGLAYIIPFFTVNGKINRSAGKGDYDVYSPTRLYNLKDTVAQYAAVSAVSKNSYVQFAPITKIEEYSSKNSKLVRVNSKNDPLAEEIAFMNTKAQILELPSTITLDDIFCEMYQLDSVEELKHLEESKDYIRKEYDLFISLAKIANSLAIKEGLASNCYLYYAEHKVSDNARLFCTSTGLPIIQGKKSMRHLFVSKETGVLTDEAKALVKRAICKELLNMPIISKKDNREVKKVSLAHIKHMLKLEGSKVETLEEKVRYNYLTKLVLALEGIPTNAMLEVDFRMSNGQIIALGTGDVDLLDKVLGDKDIRYSLIAPAYIRNIQETGLDVEIPKETVKTGSLVLAYGSTVRGLTKGEIDTEESVEIQESSSFLKLASEIIVNKFTVNGEVKTQQILDYLNENDPKLSDPRRKLKKESNFSIEQLEWKLGYFLATVFYNTVKDVAPGLIQSQIDFTEEVKTIISKAEGGVPVKELDYLTKIDHFRSNVKGIEVQYNLHRSSTEDLRGTDISRLDDYAVPDWVKVDMEEFAILADYKDRGVQNPWASVVKPKKYSHIAKALGVFIGATQSTDAYIRHNITSSVMKKWADKSYYTIHDAFIMHPNYACQINDIARGVLCKLVDEESIYKEVLLSIGGRVTETDYHKSDEVKAKLKEIISKREVVAL